MTTSHSTTARTVRFPNDLRERIAQDADRCGRSFEQQVLAILRRHYGEDVDLAPEPEAVLALVRAGVAGMSEAEQALVSSRPAHKRAARSRRA